MKKKIALVLASVMLLAMPASAFAAISEADAAEIENDVMEINNWENASEVNIGSGGTTAEEVSSGYLPKDANGNVITDASGKADLSGYVKEDDPNFDAAHPSFDSASTGISGCVIGGTHAGSGGDSLPIKVSFDDELAGSDLVKSYAVLMVDLDAKDGNGDNLVHWMAVGFAPDADGNLDIAANASAQLAQSATVKQGASYNGVNAYAGPNPPTGSTHTYRVIVYALDSAAPFTTDGYNYSQFQNAIDGKVLAHTSFDGTFTAR